MPEFFFQRYVDGIRMADDVLITKQPTLEDAIPAALRLCRNSPRSVLVHLPQGNWLDVREGMDKAAEIARKYPATIHGALNPDPAICARQVAYEIAAAIMAAMPQEPPR